MPRWLVDDRESVLRDAEPYRGLTPEERATDLVAACRAAARLMASRDDRARVLAHVDPLPASSKAAWARLRSTCVAKGRSHGR